MELDSLESVAERSSILENPSHPLYDELFQMGSSFSHWIILPRFKMERFRHSFVPSAIRLYNSSGDHNTQTLLDWLYTLLCLLIYFVIYYTIQYHTILYLIVYSILCYTTIP